MSLIIKLISGEYDRPWKVLELKHRSRKSRERPWFWKNPGKVLAMGCSSL